MRRLALIIGLALFVQSFLSAQFVGSCLPDGITFNTQVEIDNFQTNHPNCTEIEGDVTVKGYFSISNLEGLNTLTHIGGDLSISKNDQLIDLSGLNSLTTIEGDLTISWNSSLVSLTGLDNLASIEGGLSIRYNDSFSNCEAQWLCDYLSNPNGSVNIHYNKPGCNNPTEIAEACGITLPCLPFGNYYFFNQSQIDDFKTHYPGCTTLEGYVKIGHWRGSDITNLNGLDGVTSIGGDINFSGNDVLTNLSGLNNVTSIGGDIFIGDYVMGDNPSLTSLTGLENVTSIGGDLSIESCPSLTSLTGLESLTSIEGSLLIGPSIYPAPGMDASTRYNNTLSSLKGLDNLTSIGGGLRINDNDSLTSLTGLENVEFIGGDVVFFYNNALESLSGIDSLPAIEGDLRIYGNNALSSLSGLGNLNSIEGTLSIGQKGTYGYEWYNGNPSLTSLTGLEGLTSIGENLYIMGNDTLVSLTGLENLISIGGGLSIKSNGTLSTCEAQGLCDYLANPNGVVDIINNATGCNNPPEIANNCGITLPCLPFGNYYLFTQSQIDNFQTDYPNCSELEGSLTISGNDINNLNGLSTITAIGEDLLIYDNDTLSSLIGLENLTSIGGTLSIGFSYSGEGPGIIYRNPSLTSLSGLNNLISIGEQLVIEYNDTLVSLSGLDNIDAESIENLIVFHNPSLSACAIQSVCDYLASPGGNIYIYDNAPGCNSQDEVEEACDPVSLDEVQLSEKFLIFPNPASTQITVELRRQPQKDAFISIYNTNNQQLISRRIAEQKTVLDLSGLPGGFYFVKVADDRTVMVDKLVKE